MTPVGAQNHPFALNSSNVSLVVSSLEWNLIFNILFTFAVSNICT